jgi:hypothetical protein
MLIGERITKGPSHDHTTGRVRAVWGHPHRRGCPAARNRPLLGRDLLSGTSQADRGRPPAARPAFLSLWFEPAWKHSEHADSPGLDYGAVQLGKLEQLALAKNQIKVLPLAAWQQTLGKEWDEYFMFGLPTDSIEIRKTPLASGLNIRANARPTLIHIEHFDGDLRSLPSTPFPRFYGKRSENWPKGEIDGMSGAPVFGFNTRTGEYGLMAIQSGWLNQRRLTFACPVSEFGPRLIAAIQARGATP